MIDKNYLRRGDEGKTRPREVARAEKDHIIVILEIRWMKKLWLSWRTVQKYGRDLKISRKIRLKLMK